MFLPVTGMTRNVMVDGRGFFNFNVDSNLVFIVGGMCCGLWFSIGVFGHFGKESLTDHVRNGH